MELPVDTQYGYGSYVRESLSPKNSLIRYSSSKLRNLNPVGEKKEENAGWL